MPIPNPFTSHVLTREQAEPVLAPVAPVLTESLWTAWDWLQALLDQDPQRRVILADTSTLASMLSNAFYFFAKPKLVDASVVWEAKGRMQHGLVGAKVDLRFKKFDPELHSMNVDTVEQRMRYGQEPIPGATLATQVTFGYTVDRLARTLTGIYFVCPRGYRENFWSWELYGTGDGGQMSFIGNPPESGDGSQDAQPALNIEINIANRRTGNE